jgi:hypothetical protein
VSANDQTTKMLLHDVLTRQAPGMTHIVRFETRTRGVISLTVRS